MQIITPSKKGMVGTKELNKKIQALINPNIGKTKEKTVGQTIFREGDNIMQMKNNYDIEWEQDGEIGTGIFNGEMGKITKISNIGETVSACYERKNRYIYFSRIRPN